MAHRVGRVLSNDQIERALVITAHPDDVDFGAAGTVAKLTDDGVSVTYCVVTDGQAVIGREEDPGLGRPARSLQRREHGHHADQRLPRHLHRHHLRHRRQSGS